MNRIVLETTTPGLGTDGDSHTHALGPGAYVNVYDAGGRPVATHTFPIQRTSDVQVIQAALDYVKARNGRFSAFDRAQLLDALVKVTTSYQAQQ